MSFTHSENRTPRQRLLEALTGSLRSARDLAQELGLPEREIEDHLVHVARSIKHDSTRRFQHDPAYCRECGFIFRGRSRLTRPSRCPRCRQESIVPPRFGIQLVESPQ